MTDRITRKDLAAVFELTRQAAVKAGIAEASRWHLEVGSKTYGRAYRVWLAHEDYEEGIAGKLGSDWHSGHYSPVVRDFLGMTAAEAYRTLSILRDAFNAVIWARDKA